MTVSKPEMPLLEKHCTSLPRLRVIDTHVPSRAVTACHHLGYSLGPS